MANREIIKTLNLNEFMNSAAMKSNSKVICLIKAEFICNLFDVQII